MILLVIFSFIPFLSANVYAEDTYYSVNKMYSAAIYDNINANLEILHNDYPDFTELRTIGFSVNGKEIKALKVGNGEKSILINGTHHAREMMTAILCEEQAKYIANKYTQNPAVQAALDKVSIWFVPLVNPDGALIAFSSSASWKANVRGVDLNRNYPTTGKKITVFAPASKEYHGPYPFSEPETQALRDFCYEKNFETAIAYHSAGQIIYWYFYQQNNVLDDSKRLALILSKQTGYQLVPQSESKGGYGFTDWFISEFNRPGFTVEIGRTVNSKPLALWEYPGIWNKNKDIPLTLAYEIIGRQTKALENLSSHSELKKLKPRRAEKDLNLMNDK